MKQRYFNSKILLFGEYAVLQNGTALGIPFEQYKAEWKFDGSRKKDDNLFAFYKYLLEHFSGQFDAANFDNEILNGLRLESSVPTGMGLGSSATLTAACYARYFFDKSEKAAELKSIFSKMESFFHGTSSGFDPLISYFNACVKIQKDTFQIIKEQIHSPTHAYLLDSKIPRKAHNLIPIFEKKFQHSGFQNTIESLKEFNEICINGLFEDQSISKEVKKISALQFKYFKEMIPESILPLWELGLQTDQYYMKLCGAGGGGYFLLFSDKRIDLPNTKQIF